MFQEESETKRQERIGGWTNLEVGLGSHGSERSTVRSCPSARVRTLNQNNLFTNEEHAEEKFQVLKSTLESTSK